MPDPIKRTVADWHEVPHDPSLSHTMRQFLEWLRGRAVKNKSDIADNATSVTDLSDTVAAMPTGQVNKVVAGDGLTGGGAYPTVTLDVGVTSPLTVAAGSVGIVNQSTSTNVLHGNAAGNATFGKVVEADQSLSDVLTANVTITAHGYAPKLPNDATKYLDGTGNYTTPPTGGSGTVTTTGSPASGNLTKFSGTTSITNGDLSGDVTTAGTLVATVVNLPNLVTQAGSILVTDIAAPSAPAAAHLKVFGDSTDLRLHDINAAGTIGTTVVADTGTSHNFLTAISTAGVISKARPSCADLSDAGSGCSGTSSSGGTVTSVSFTGGLISVANPTTTPALTVAGTSGGIPYFSGASTWASSAVLTANLPVFGGGAGTTPFVGTRSGNTTSVATTTGSFTSGNCLTTDSSGNVIDSGLNNCQGSGGASTVGGIIGGQANNGVSINPFDLTGTSVHMAFESSFSLSGPALCLTGIPAVNQWTTGMFGTGTSVGAAGAAYNTTPTVVKNLSTNTCVQQTKSVFYYTGGSGLTGQIGTGLGSPTTNFWSASVTGAAVQPLGQRVGTTVAAATTVYSGIGHGNSSPATTTDEQQAQLPIANDGTITNLCIETTTAQASNGALTVTLRKNGAGTTSTITIASSGAAGRRCDTTHSISYTAGDKVSVELVNASATLTTGTIQAITYEFTPTASGMTALIPFPKQNRALTASTTRYTAAFINDVLQATESSAWAAMPRAGTAKNLRCYQKTAPANTMNATLYKNGSPTSLVVAGTNVAGSNVVVSDTTHTVSFSSLDSFSLEWAPGSGAQGVWSGCTMEFD